MKIGLDAKRYFFNRTGLGNFSRDLIRIFQEGLEGTSYYLFTPKDPGELKLPANTQVVIPSSHKPFWRQFSVVHNLNQLGIDFYIGPSNELPFSINRFKGTSVVVIHDIIFREFPNQYNSPDRFIYHLKTLSALKKASVIVASSHATARALEKYYGVSKDMIRVIYLSCHPIFRKPPEAELLNSVQEKYKLPEKFLLYVSSFQQRKNHLNLLKAYSQSGIDMPLVLVGSTGDTVRSVKKIIADLGIGNRIICFYQMPLAELASVYRKAFGFIYPSLAEGFGIPLLEAMYSGLPVAHSNIAVFNELAGETSVRFNPKDTESIAGALRLLESGGVKAELPSDKLSETSILNDWKSIFDGK